MPPSLAERCLRAGLARRGAIVLLAALLGVLPAAVPDARAQGSGASEASRDRVGPAAQASSLTGFGACLEQVRARALAEGVSPAGFERHTRELVPDADVLSLLDAQPEFRTPIWDYLAALVDRQRIDDGRAALARWQRELAAIEERFGVDPATVVAVWGVESDYGQRYGKRPVMRSLATLACFGRRQSFFRGELIAGLKILEAGHFEPERFVGSWAGAFGQTQFMPSTFLRSAVDVDGDGRRDIVDSIPDALGSTANFLRGAGWRQGEPWGFEVRLPAGFDASRAGRRDKRPLAAWIADGIVHADGRPIVPDSLGLSGASRAAVLLPARADASAEAATRPGPGPAFIVLRNFDALYRYNAAESYALAIALLSDHLRGRGGLLAEWPTDDPGLGRAERRELQERLLARGHDIGAVDGLIGSRTRAAIEIEQQRLGLPATGRAGRRILEALRATP